MMVATGFCHLCKVAYAISHVCPPRARGFQVLDPGHLYRLSHLDGDGTQTLRFVKRIGDNFPGNQPPGYEGTTSQEVLRALLDRQKYVEGQQPCSENQLVIDYLRQALVALELRAARVRGDDDAWTLISTHEMVPTWPEDMPTCSVCGHLFCKQGRHR